MNDWRGLQDRALLMRTFLLSNLEIRHPNILLYVALSINFDTFCLYEVIRHAEQQKEH